MKLTDIGKFEKQNENNEHDFIQWGSAERKIGHKSIFFTYQMHTTAW